MLSACAYYGHDLNLQGNIAYGACVPLFVLNGSNGGRKAAAARYRRDGCTTTTTTAVTCGRHCRRSFSVGEGSFLAR